VKSQPSRFFPQRGFNNFVTGVAQSFRRSRMRLHANQIRIRQSRAHYRREFADVRAAIDHAIKIQRAQMRVEFLMPLPDSRERIEWPREEWDRAKNPEKRNS
jgi:Holliday junction resolvase RusA-like endonuclease